MWYSISIDFKRKLMKGRLPTNGDNESDLYCLAAAASSVCALRWTQRFYMPSARCVKKVKIDAQQFRGDGEK